MRIWKAQFFDKDMGAQLSWWPSQRSATKHLHALQAERKANGGEASGVEGVWPFDVPATKLGLLAFLNQHFTSDNG